MRAGPDLPYRALDSGIALRVRLTPKAARDAVEACEPTAEGPALKARVRAVPEDGAANAAVERLIAGWLGVPKSSVTVAHGGKSRLKTLAIAGAPALLAEKIEAALARLGA